MFGLARPLQDCGSPKTQQPLQRSSALPLMLLALPTLTRRSQVTYSQQGHILKDSHIYQTRIGNSGHQRPSTDAADSPDAHILTIKPYGSTLARLLHVNVKQTPPKTLISYTDNRGSPRASRHSHLQNQNTEFRAPMHFQRRYWLSRRSQESLTYSQ